MMLKMRQQPSCFRIWIRAQMAIPFRTQSQQTEGIRRVLVLKKWKRTKRNFSRMLSRWKKAEMEKNMAMGRI